MLPTRPAHSHSVTVATLSQFGNEEKDLVFGGNFMVKIGGLGFTSQNSFAIYTFSLESPSAAENGKRPVAEVFSGF